MMIIFYIFSDLKIIHGSSRVFLIWSTESLQLQYYYSAGLLLLLVAGSNSSRRVNDLSGELS